MTSWIWHQDSFKPGDALPIADRGVRHGLSLFETLAVRNGRTRFVDEHLALLAASAQTQAWPVPAGFLAATAALLAEPGFDHGSARIYLTAGPGAAGDPAGPCGGFALLEPGAPSQPPPALQLTWASAPLLSAVPGLKTGNYWFHHAARLHAQQAGFDDALIVNVLDELVCSAMANVFVVIEGSVATPPLASGARPGVIRDWVLQNAGAVEKTIRREDLARASELFLTNSLVGIRPARSIGSIMLPETGIASNLAEKYEAIFAK